MEEFKAVVAADLVTLVVFLELVDGVSLNDRRAYGRQQINMINICVKSSIWLPRTRLWCFLVGGIVAYVKMKLPSTAYV